MTTLTSTKSLDILDNQSSQYNKDYLGLNSEADNQEMAEAIEDVVGKIFNQEEKSQNNTSQNNTSQNNVSKNNEIKNNTIENNKIEDGSSEISEIDNSDAESDESEKDDEGGAETSLSLIISAQSEQHEQDKPVIASTIPDTTLGGYTSPNDQYTVKEIGNSMQTILIDDDGQDVDENLKKYVSSANSVIVESEKSKESQPKSLLMRVMPDWIKNIFNAIANFFISLKFSFFNRASS